MIVWTAYGLFLTLPKLLLSFLQLRFLQQESSKKPYILTKENFIKAAEYANIKEKIAILNVILDFILTGFWLLYGFSTLDAWLDLIPLFKAVVFVLCYLVVSFLLGLPLSAYETLVLDKRFGFAKGGVKLFVLDSLKSFVLLILIGGILIFVFSFIIINVAQWELYAFILGSVLIVSVNVLYPLLIARMFNKFTPLQDGTLKDSINALLERVGFKSNGVFVMDASRRDGRLNAYFAGLGSAKRVILFDTLLEKVPKDSILAVLGHELGHFKHYDIYKMMALVVGFFGFLLFLIAQIPQAFFEMLHLEANAHSLIVILFVLSSPVGFYFMLLVNFLSCKNEFNADKFGAHLTSAESLAKALLILVKENNAFPLAHPLFMRFYYSHPPLMARLIALECKELGESTDIAD